MSATFTALITATGTVGQIDITGGEYPVYSIANNPVLPGNGSVVVPSGTTGQRLLGLGAIRLNTTTGFFECSSDNATWQNLAVGGGGVASVTGTAGFITATAGPNVVIDIDPTYIGQNTITTLGTITSGIWNAGNVTTAQLNAGNLQLSANDLISTNLNGNINIVPNGTGSVSFLTGGGVILTSTSQLVGLSQLAVGNLHLLTNLIEATNPNGSITLLPDGTGFVNIGATAAASSEIRLYEMTGSGVNFIGFKSPNALAGDTTYILPVAFPAVSGYVLSSDTSGNTSWIVASTGSVTSVSGTLNRITSTGGTTPVIDISGSYVGQTSITTLGTIGTGVWQGSVIGLTYGGTNANLTASNGGIVWSNATQMQILAGTATANQMLQSGATATPAWSTTTWPATSTINQILYSSSANVIGQITAANSATLVTSGSGVPSLQTLTAGQILVGTTAGAPAAATITNGAGSSVVSSSGAIAANIVINRFCDGRLSLAISDPAPTSDILAATTIYFVPYLGSYLALFTSGAWKLYTFSQISIAVPATTGTVYDIFVFDNAGTLTLQLVAWTNPTTRATSLSAQDGVYCKSGDLGKRYLGTFSTTGVSGQTEDSVLNRLLYNYYNRLPRYLRVFDTTASWTYTTATYRQANGNAANQVKIIIGLAEDQLKFTVSTLTSNTSAGVSVISGIGINSTTTNSVQIQAVDTIVANQKVRNEATLLYTPSIGLSTLAWLEFSIASGTTTWYGQSGVYLSGMYGFTNC